MKILFGVFDWGLGHSTRSMPLIKGLLDEGHEVHILTTGRALKVLSIEFKDKCKYFDVPSIGLEHTKTRFFVLNFILNIPRMLNNIRKGKKTVREIIKKEKYDKIISDGRVDVYDTNQNSYLINHQLRFKTPLGTQTIAEFILSRLMKNYKYLIVPDFENNGLSGILGHNLKFIKKDRIKYIGILSRIKEVKLKKDIDYFISLSGPEPQRTILEENILSQIKSINGKIVIAGGNPDIKINSSLKKVRFYSFLDAKKQEKMMNSAKFIITRTGYTTMMEFCEVGIKNALLIPTPGQTEQEYLGDLYEEKKYFHHVSQYKLNLKQDIDKCKEFKGFSQKAKTKDSVKIFLKLIKN